MRLASNLQVIYLTLIGLTDLFNKNISILKNDENGYYQLETDADSISKAMKEENAYHFLAKDFIKANPNHCIPKIAVADSDYISIVEYAPRIYRNIRKSIITEETLFKSLIPSVNYNGIH